MEEEDPRPSMRRTLLVLIAVASLFWFGAWRFGDPLGTALGMIGFLVGAVALVVAVWWRATEAAGLDPRGASRSG